jgi:hypothetical protein
MTITAITNGSLSKRKLYDFYNNYIHVGERAGFSMEYIADCRKLLKPVDATRR